MHTSMIGKVASMPRKYDEGAKAKAVRLVVEPAGDHASENEAIKTMSVRLGLHPESLRKWIRQTEIEAGGASDPGARGALGRRGRVPLPFRVHVPQGGS
jgi:transposase-like protein